MRARAIKPGFWDNELLAECDPFARLLFIGLWNLADRAGRLEDRPARIKKTILGYDAVDVVPLLEQLAERGFIQRYEVDGRAFIQVINFAKHQNPHVKEPESTIPAPCESGASPVQTPDEPCGLPLTHSLTPDSRDPAAAGAREAAAAKRHLAPVFAGYGEQRPGFYETVAERYPAIPLDVEALKMASWLDEHPKQRPKRADRFVLNWLDKALARRTVAPVNGHARAGPLRMSRRPDGDDTDEFDEFMDTTHRLLEGTG